MAQVQLSMQPQIVPYVQPQGVQMVVPAYVSFVPSQPIAPPASAGLSKEQAKDLLIKYVANQTCYGAGASKEATIEDILNPATFNVDVWSFLETRHVHIRKECFRGGPIDGPLQGMMMNAMAGGGMNAMAAMSMAAMATAGVMGAGMGQMAPPPVNVWEQILPPNTIIQPFIDTKIEIVVPHSQYTQMCDLCKATGNCTCPHCSGMKHEQCNHCSGSGKKTCQHCNGQQMAQPCHHCHGSGHMHCQNCNGSGRMHCHECKGQGVITCRDCQGFRTLLLTQIVTVTWKVHKQSDVVQPDKMAPAAGQPVLPDDKVRNASGTTIVQMDAGYLGPEHMPMQVHRAVHERYLASLGAHTQLIFKEGARLLVQRVIVRTVPVFEIKYKFKNTAYMFWACGNEMNVYESDYAQNCCWVCHCTIS